MEHFGEGPCADPAQVRFELRECHLDRVQVGAVARQEEEPARRVAPCLGSGGAFVGGKVVEDDNGSGFQFWYQHLLDLGCECFAIHRAFDDPRCNQRVRAEACDEGVLAP